MTFLKEKNKKKEYYNMGIHPEFLPDFSCTIALIIHSRKGVKGGNEENGK